MSEAEVKWLLCGLLFVAKLGDNLSTWLVTPTLKLEANPIARKGRWVFVWLTMLVCFLPYLSIEASLVALPVFLAVAANNFSGLWTAKALGEDGTLKLYVEIARKGTFGLAVAGEALRCVFIVISGGVVFWLGRGNHWVQWLACGLMGTGPVLMYYHLVFFRKMFKKAQEDPAAAGS